MLLCVVLSDFERQRSFRLDDRLMREVDIMQRLRHPNIIRLVEALDTPEQVKECPRGLAGAPFELSRFANAARNASSVVRLYRAVP